MLLGGQNLTRDCIGLMGFVEHLPHVDHSSNVPTVTKGNKLCDCN